MENKGAIDIFGHLKEYKEVSLNQLRSEYIKGTSNVNKLMAHKPIRNKFMCYFTSKHCYQL